MFQNLIKKAWALCFFAFSFYSVASTETPLSSLEIKEKAIVEAKLLTETNQIIVAVNGMCCKNCAIGIGKKVSKVANVDTKALPSGINIDRINSLLTIAHKANQKPKIPEILDAIKKAGYDPVRVYQLNSDMSISMTTI